VVHAVLKKSKGAFLVDSLGAERRWAAGQNFLTTCSCMKHTAMHTQILSEEVPNQRD